MIQFVNQSVLKSQLSLFKNHYLYKKGCLIFILKKCTAFITTPLYEVSYNWANYDNFVPAQLKGDILYWCSIHINVAVSYSFFLLYLNVKQLLSVYKIIND